MKKIFLGLNVDAELLEAAVAKAVQILMVQPDTREMRASIGKEALAVGGLGELTHTNPYIRDACLAVSQARVWADKLKTLAADLDGYAELTFPDASKDRIVGAPMTVIRDATNYATVACVLYQYISMTGVFPQLKEVARDDSD
jgi:hypothetical protein